jgi:hypothetical protein
MTPFVMTPEGRQPATWLALPEPPREDGLAQALGENPTLVSSLVHGGVGAAAGASLGALAGLVWWPAHVGALALTAGGALGTVAAAHGWQAGERVAEQIGMPEVEPTPLEVVGAHVHDVVTTSTGSMLLDTAIGAGVGYALAPSLIWILAGAALAGLGGIAGIALLAGAAVATQQSRR